MKMHELMNKALPQMPAEITAALVQSRITGTAFERKNEILSDPALQREVGWKRLDDGSYLVSMTCPMPGITPEMIAWWFWWHAQADERYQVWFPGAHLGIGYPRKQKAYFTQAHCPAFQPNTHFPVEKIGNTTLPLRIDFLTPEEFGFSGEVMERNHIPLIVCGHVGAFRGLVMHTEMAHIFRQTDDGLFLTSRFWLGRTLKNPLLRKRIITEELAKDMAEHCCVEYRNLREILPGLYEAYGTKRTTE